MIDLSKFFITYTPIVKEYKKNRDEIYSLPIFNPYSPLSLELPTNYNLPTTTSQSVSLWDTLWSKPSTHSSDTLSTTTETESIDLTEEDMVERYNRENPDSEEKKSPNVKFDGTYYTFISGVAPLVEKNLRKANLVSNLGLSELQIKDNVRRITLQFCFETGGGTNLGAKQNNLGGMVYSPRYLKYGMYQGKGKHGAFKTLDGFFQAYFEPGAMYTGRYKSALYATSDREFINRLKAKGYFEDDPNHYYNGTFNVNAVKAYNRYTNG